MRFFVLVSFAPIWLGLFVAIQPLQFVLQPPTAFALHYSGWWEFIGFGVPTLLVIGGLVAVLLRPGVTSSKFAAVLAGASLWGAAQQANAADPDFTVFMVVVACSLLTVVFSFSLAWQYVTEARASLQPPSN